MKKIKPDDKKTETYRYTKDDGCLVVSSGDKTDAPKVWLSKSMCKWISDNYKKVLGLKEKEIVLLKEGKVKLQGIRPIPKTEKPDLNPSPQK